MHKKVAVVAIVVVIASILVALFFQNRQSTEVIQTDIETGRDIAGLADITEEEAILLTTLQRRTQNGYRLSTQQVQDILASIRQPRNANALRTSILFRILADDARNKSASEADLHLVFAQERVRNSTSYTEAEVIGSLNVLAQHRRAPTTLGDNRPGIQAHLRHLNRNKL